MARLSSWAWTASPISMLHSGRHNEEAQLCAFDILAEGGDDLRKLPLSTRKANLERLLARRPEGILNRAHPAMDRVMEAFR